MDQTGPVKSGIVLGAVLGVTVFLVAGGASAPTPSQMSVVTAPTLQRVAQHMTTAPRPPPQKWGAVAPATPADLDFATASAVPRVDIPEAPAAGPRLLAPLLLVAGGVAMMAAGVLRFWGTRRAPQSQLEPLAMAAVTGAPDGEVSRRAALAGAVLASGLTTGAPAQAVPLKPLGDSIEALITEKIVDGSLGISVPEILRLVLHDTLTFDLATKTGGFGGSIRFPEELGRPENVGLAPVVSKLEALQKELQEATGVNLSFTDTVAFAGQMILAQDFKATLCSRVGACDVVYNGYGNKPKRLPLGRQDFPSPDPEGRIPWTGSSVEDFKQAFKGIGLTAKDLCTCASGLLEDPEAGEALLMTDKQCAGILKDLEKSKQTTTRTTYEVTLFNAYTRLVNVARIDPKAYA
eukprot:CAMPEP_0174302568 /NCGR_PEP_ID=MMETSP0809-20121228/59697_1 /TAXON_ID=73025 ORGANISM="Eutreptiella gymnastica-like, Strain CCMP1594" /NCGR_SAMPLE_ID=MMETSP0809 /ASSEMBLY_ACC=CAM_ASM_000658 /LENGTH=406 /DNA_ID=CAMNT_0015408485 /DNA_START=31 /DNA_END=1251 /DNA_ORIENTATION=-